jgi:hypothetical protein
MICTMMEEQRPFRPRLSWQEQLSCEQLFVLAASIYKLGHLYLTVRYHYNQAKRLSQVSYPKYSMPQSELLKIEKQ